MSSENVSELEICYNLYIELFKQFNVKFFDKNFICIALYPTELMEEADHSYVSGKFLFLLALRSYMSECRELNDLKFLLTDQNNLVHFILNLSKQLE